MCSHSGYTSATNKPPTGGPRSVSGNDCIPRLPVILGPNQVGQSYKIPVYGILIFIDISVLIEYSLAIQKPTTTPGVAAKVSGSPPPSEFAPETPPKSEPEPSGHSTPPKPAKGDSETSGTKADEVSKQPGEGEAGGKAEEGSGEGAYNPETGEINWDCPCLGGMAHGPCGPEFREAFSCFIYSEQEPKGIDCVEKFKGMQDCFRRHPEVYSEGSCVRLVF